MPPNFSKKQSGAINSTMRQFFTLICVLAMVLIGAAVPIDFNQSTGAVNNAGTAPVNFPALNVGGVGAATTNSAATSATNAYGAATNYAAGQATNAYASATNSAAAYTATSLLSSYTTNNPPASNSTNTITPTRTTTAFVDVLPAGTTPYTNSVVINDAGANTNSIVSVNAIWPTSTNATLAIYDNAATGTPIKTLTSTVNGGSSELEFHLSNLLHWWEFSKGELATRNVDPTVQAAVKNAVNTANGPVVSNGSNQIAQSTTGNAATASAVLFSGVTSRPGFVPTDIPNLKLWVSASRLNLANGTAVSSITDLTGTGATLSQATGGDQPLYESNGINGHPALLFNGSSDFLTSSFSMSTAWDTAFTIATVIKGVSFSSSGNCMFGTSDVHMYQAWTGGGAMGFFTGSTQRVLFGVSNPLAPIQVLITSYDGTTIRNFVNGVEISDVAYSGAIGETLPINIGSPGSGGGSFCFNAYIGDVLIYNQGISSDQGIALSNYLLNAYDANGGPRLINVGDSITEGIHGNGTATGGFSESILNQLGMGQFLGINDGISGNTIVNYLSQAPTQVLRGVRITPGSIVTVAYGTNDLTAGTSTSTILADIYSLCDQIRALGAKVVLGDVLPQSTSGVSGWETNRQTVNTSLISGWTNHADAFVPQGEDSVMGPYYASTNTTYYYSDAIHPIAAGYAILGPDWAAGVRHVLHQPTILTGTFTAGSCTITNTAILSNSAIQVYEANSGTNGAPYVYGYVGPVSGASGTATIKSPSTADTNSLLLYVQ